MKEKNIKAEKKNSTLYKFEENFWQKNESVCGVDEVGRGCLAGPIVTAAVILNPYAYHEKIKDSKLLRPIQLENIYTWILQNSLYAIGISNARIIDEINIYKTTQITMKKSLVHLLALAKKLPEVIAIDAMPLSLQSTPYKNITIESFIKGESKSASIAAASIVAKVTRDRIMQNMHTAFPSYHMNKHKGYGTATHITALQNNQASIIHRTTFIKNFQKGTNHEQSEQQNIFC